MADPEFLPVYVFRVSMAGAPEREARIPCAAWHRLLGSKWHGWFDLDQYEPQPQPSEGADERAIMHLTTPVASGRLTAWQRRTRPPT